MKKILDLALPPQVAFNEELFTQHIANNLRLKATDTFTIRKLKRSIDARSRQIKVNVGAEVYIGEQAPPLLSYKKDFPDVVNAPQAIIIGGGPAGMFAALRLIELGIKPIVLERGKDVRARRRDLAAITKHHIVNPDSNYCFGEGGAGTYSDGKLYTRSKKRGDVRRITGNIGSAWSHRRYSGRCASAYWYQQASQYCYCPSRKYFVCRGRVLF